MTNTSNILSNTSKILSNILSNKLQYQDNRHRINREARDKSGLREGCPYQYAVYKICDAWHPNNNREWYLSNYINNQPTPDTQTYPHV